jgi:hypothetical protein
LYSEDTILERLSQDLERLACALQPRIEAQEAMTCQRHLPGHGNLATADRANTDFPAPRGLSIRR